MTKVTKRSLMKSKRVRKVKVLLEPEEVLTALTMLETVPQGIGIWRTDPYAEVARSLVSYVAVKMSLPCNCSRDERLVSARRFKGIRGDLFLAGLRDEAPEICAALFLLRSSVGNLSDFELGDFEQQDLQKLFDALNSGKSCRKKLSDGDYKRLIAYLELANAFYLFRNVVICIHRIKRALLQSSRKDAQIVDMLREGIDAGVRRKESARMKSLALVKRLKGEK